MKTAVQVALPLTSTFSFHFRRSLTSRWPARSWRCWPWPTASTTWRSAWGEWWWPVTKTGIPSRQKIWWVRPLEDLQRARCPCSFVVRRMQVFFLLSTCEMGSQRVLHTPGFPLTSLCVLQPHNVLTDLYSVLINGCNQSRWTLFHKLFPILASPDLCSAWSRVVLRPVRGFWKSAISASFKLRVNLFLKDKKEVGPPLWKGRLNESGTFLAPACSLGTLASVILCLRFGFSIVKAGAPRPDSVVGSQLLFE